MKSSKSEVKMLCAQIAACTRIMNAEGLIDYSGHVSARLSDNSGLVIQTFDASRAALSPDDLLVCDFDGNVVGGPSNKPPPREVFIHTEIFKIRSDVGAVGHFHPETATMFTLLEEQPLVPVKNHAARWADGIPIHPDPGHINSVEKGQALAETLGRCHAALIRAHGVVVTSETVPSLLVDSVHFEENAQTLSRAAALGKVKGLSDGEMKTFEKRFNRAAHIGKLWKYFVVRGVEAGYLPRDWDLEIYNSSSTAIRRPGEKIGQRPS